MLFYLLACMQFFIPAHVLQEAQWEYKALHEHVLTQYLSTYRQADYLSWLFYRLNVEVVPMLLNLPFSIFPVFSMLLFGLYTAKKGLVHNIEQNHSFFKKIQLITGAAGFTLTIILAMLKTEILRYELYQQAAIHLFTSLSGIFLCFFYLTTLLLFLQFSPYASMLVLFKYSGTMALTTYLSQTLICLCIVRVFGLYGSLTLTESTIICLIIYTLQLFSISGGFIISTTVRVNGYGEALRTDPSHRSDGTEKLPFNSKSAFKFESRFVSFTVKAV